jgi:hypothetical protein
MVIIGDKKYKHFLWFLWFGETRNEKRRREGGAAYLSWFLPVFAIIFI